MSSGQYSPSFGEKIIVFLPEEMVSVKSSVDKLDDLECAELPALEELDDERERFFLSDIKERSSYSFFFRIV